MKDRPPIYILSNIAIYCTIQTCKLCCGAQVSRIALEDKLGTLAVLSFVSSKLHLNGDGISWKRESRKARVQYT